MNVTFDDLDDDQQAEDDESLPGRSWMPVDLGPILNGDYKRPEPSIGIARTDGLRMLYPGKEHSVIGEMESGKSWYALACCVAELQAGDHVVYIHFEEGDPTDTVERLIALGVPADTISKQFRFVSPEEPVQVEYLAALLNPAPTLVILDGVNEAMSLHNLGVREEDGAAGFRRRLVKPWTRVGAAVLSADHVVKDRERRDRGPLGSVHKGNGLSGSLIMLENAEPFGRGQRGRSHVYVTKDRPGHLRREGRPVPKVPGKTFMGELVVDDTRMFKPYLELTFWAPKDHEDAEDGGAPMSEEAARIEADDARILDVVRRLIDNNKPANVRNVRATSGISNPRTDDALARLVLAGLLVETIGPKNARLFAESEVKG